MQIEEYGEISEELKTKVNFQNLVGTYLLGEAKWSLDAGDLENVDIAKASFYEALEKFNLSDYTPTEKIKAETLAVFMDYKESDWKDRDNLKKIIEYFKSMAY
jgi:hypothetical protein